MFKRFTIIFVTLFIFSILFLSFAWRSHTGLETYSSTPVTKVHRISQDLGGRWNSYPFLKQAWAREEILNKNEGMATGLKQTKSIVIPSNKGLHVIAKQFKVSSQWSSRTSQLVLEGVYGEARVYLNGIDDIHYIGQVNGMGGTHKLEISAARFDFSQDNIFFIEFLPGTVQKEKLFGWIWPSQGRITGQMKLEAVPETTLDASNLSFSYNNSTKRLIVTTVLNHHQSLDKEPWVINAVLKDNEQKIAENLLPVSSNGMYVQEISLIFDLPNPIFWSIDNPFLYYLDLSVINSRGDIDSVQIPLGISQLAQESGKWMLNNQVIDIQGLVITQEDDYQIRNRQLINHWLKEVKDDGINLIYFMGFFPDESWLYAANDIGIGIWLELPVNMVPNNRIPEPINYASIVRVNTRHPSVMAWTAAKGLENTQASENYLKKAKQMLANKPVYHLAYTPHAEAVRLADNIQLTPEGFEGLWGSVQFNQHPLGIETNNTHGWEQEKTAAVLWFIWLVFISVQNLRALNWKYSELFYVSPKRTVREASFWRCVSLLSRMGTIGGVITAVLYRLSLDIPPWLPYDLDVISVLQGQNPFLIWLFVSMFLLVWRLLQVGVAAPAFPNNPSSLGLASWLERKYGWVFIVGLAWILTFYKIAYYVPLFVYFLLWLAFLPVRVRDVWQIQGKYSYLALVPFTICAVALIVCLWYWQDFLYVWSMIVPQITQALSEMTISDWRLF